MARLREDRRFDSLGALVEQMHRDVARRPGRWELGGPAARLAGPERVVAGRALLESVSQPGRRPGRIRAVAALPGNDA